MRCERILRSSTPTWGREVGALLELEGVTAGYGGGDILHGLDLSVEEALGFFQDLPQIRNKLATIADVGLGYIRLGQPATQLSGGEAQRVKLSTELSRRDTGKTIYVLDEPTTGLHYFDVERLLNVLHRLVDHGNTVIVIEHNLDVLKTADWLIDLGPEGGDRGGEVVALGTPEQVAREPESHTGRYLRPVLERSLRSGGERRQAPPKRRRVKVPA